MISQLSGVLLIISVFILPLNLKTEKWIAPSEADSLQNPFAINDEKAIKSGKKIFNQMCWSCHGMEGDGNGPAASALEIPAGNFTSSDFQAQTDGAIFWKLTSGRGQMTAYESALSENQRWQVVSYLRSYEK